MNVLIVGNGFDIVHGLPTKYNDFLNIFKNLSTSKLSDSLDLYKKVGNCDNVFKELFLKHPEILNRTDIDKIKNLEKKLSQNSWANYYAKCEAEINGWIDFEIEMFPVIYGLKQIFEFPKFNRFSSVDNVILDMSDFDRFITKKISFLSGVFEEPTKIVPNQLKIRPQFCNMINGVLRHKILECLKNELDIFIDCYRIYLNEIVDKIDVNLNPVIDSIKADEIISFNYTKTEKEYDNLKKANIYHVHGDIYNENSMILGVNEVASDSNNDFIYFTKYFQRIRRKSDTGYKKILYNKTLNMVYLYGHSLDVTDKDIILPFIDEAKRVIIYFYQAIDYEQKVINLMKMFNRDRIENDMFSERIIFLPSDGSKIIKGGVCI